MSGECSNTPHQWTGSAQEVGLFQTSAHHCSRCGVGQLVTIKPTGARQIEVDLEIQAAQGSHTVSTLLLASFIAQWERTCKQIEGEGYTVIRGTPTIQPG